jgi:SAM-dependent methyltransferase
MSFAKVDSPAAVIEAVLEVVATDEPMQFVDYGCGRGEVLLRVAQRFPNLPCIGIDIDRDALAIVRRRAATASVRNIRLCQGNVLDHVDLAEDLAYLYLGGALNQRLGHDLLARGACRRILTARYPIIGAVASTQVSTGDSPIYVYDRAAAPGLIEWDAVATTLELPRGAAYLLSRAVRVTVKQHLTLRHRTWYHGSAARISSFEVGLSPARPGVPTICDLLLECSDHAAASGATVLEISIVAGGIVLRPSHLVIVTTTLDRPPAERLLYDLAELETVLAELHPPSRTDR